MQKWLSKHTSIQMETRYKTICFSLGINFESDLVWFNFLFWNFCFMWNVEPGNIKYYTKEEGI